MQNYEGQVPEDLRAEVFGSGSAAVSPSNQSSSDRRSSVGSVSSISSSLSAHTIGGNPANGDGDVDMIVVEDLPTPTPASNTTASTGTTGTAGKTTRQAFTTPASTTPSSVSTTAGATTGNNGGPKPKP